MKRKHALVLAFIITGLIASNSYLFSSVRKESSREEVKISRVIDGDTIQLEDGRTIRFLNINSPEKKTSLHNESLKYLKQFENSSVQVQITSSDRYERALARVYSLENKYLNLEMVEQGLASKFLVDNSELKQFKEAEMLAIKEGRGIWQKSEYSNCFSAEINEREESVILKNSCSGISLKDWLIKDESRKTYTFPEISFNEITLHSEAGEDTPSNIYWNSKQNIWNNDRDSLYLFDAQGRLAHYATYGY